MARDAEAMTIGAVLARQKVAVALLAVLSAAPVLAYLVGASPA